MGSDQAGRQCFEFCGCQVVVFTFLKVVEQFDFFKLAVTRGIEADTSKVCLAVYVLITLRNTARYQAGLLVSGEGSRGGAEVQSTLRKFCRVVPWLLYIKIR